MKNHTLPLTKCKFCGEEFISIHGNRRFCNPSKNEDKIGRYWNCKTMFNNQKAKEKRKKTKSITEIQYKNWQGLYRLYTSGKRNFTYQELTSEGIRPDCFVTTKIRPGANLKIICFIEFGLVNLPWEGFRIYRHGFGF